MKKLIGALTAFAITAVPLTAYAVEVTPGNDGVTPMPKEVPAVISTEIAPSYVVTIPTDTAIPFNSTETVIGDVTLTEARFDPGRYIYVDVAGSNKEAPALVNKADSSKTIPYSFTADTGEGFTVEDATSIEDMQLSKKGEKFTLSVNIDKDDWDKAYAGSYSDIVTFNIKYAALGTANLPDGFMAVSFMHDTGNTDEFGNPIIDSGTSVFRYNEDDTWADVAAKDYSFFKLKDGKVIFEHSRPDETTVELTLFEGTNESRGTAVSPTDKIVKGKAYIAVKV